MAAYGSAAVFDEDVDEEYRVRECIMNPTGDDRINEKILQTLLESEKTLLAQKWVRAARRNAIDWIIETRAQFKFKFHTAYLTVTYIDRYLLAKLQDENNILQPGVVPLLSLACLSLAVELDEFREVDESEISYGGVKFLSESIKRMKEDVSETLEWKLSPLNPFDFIRFFVPKCRKERPKNDVVVATVDAIFATIKDLSYMVPPPSVTAMAATLVATDRTLTRQSLEIRMNEISLIQSFDIDDVYLCYTRLLVMTQ